MSSRHAAIHLNQVSIRIVILIGFYTFRPNVRDTVGEKGLLCQGWRTSYRRKNMDLLKQSQQKTEIYIMCS